MIKLNEAEIASVYKNNPKITFLVSPKMSGVSLLLTCFELYSNKKIAPYVLISREGVPGLRHEFAAIHTQRWDARYPSRNYNLLINGKVIFFYRNLIECIYRQECLDAEVSTVSSESSVFDKVVFYSQYIRQHFFHSRARASLAISYNRLLSHPLEFKKVTDFFEEDWQLPRAMGCIAACNRALTERLLGSPVPFNIEPIETFTRRYGKMIHNEFNSRAGISWEEFDRMAQELVP